MSERLKDLVKDESGALAVMAALALTVVFCSAALGVDIGHLVAVKAQLQNAADAGALAGARGLVPCNTVSNPPQPDWYKGQTEATQTVQKNKADSQLLTDSLVQTGYWNIGTKTFQSSAIVPSPLDVPAVRVVVPKTSGKNGGPINMLFAPLIGKPTADVSAQALAFISAPGGVPPNKVFPIAVPKILVEQHWHNDPPHSFRIGSDYHDPEGGQWTTFLTDENNVPAMRNLTDNGNPSPLKINDNIWIQPGIEATVYNGLESKIGETVLLPVVNTDFSTHAYTPILGFVSFYIEDVKGGSKKYVQGHFVKFRPVEAIPGGPFYGTSVPPKLVY